VLLLTFTSQYPPQLLDIAVGILPPFQFSPLHFIHDHAAQDVPTLPIRMPQTPPANSEISNLHPISEGGIDRSINQPHEEEEEEEEEEDDDVTHGVEARERPELSGCGTHHGGTYRRLALRHDNELL